MKARLKITGLDFNPPTLFNPKASQLFKQEFKNLIKSLNEEIKNKENFSTSWCVRKEIGIPTHQLSSFTDYCILISEYNYPNLNLTFSYDFIGRSIFSISLKNRLKQTL